MILHALTEHYETLAAQNKLPSPGWNLGKVSFALSLNGDGDPLQVISLLEEKNIGKKIELRPREMQIPDFVQRTVGIEPYFLCDNATYLLGVDSKGKPERARKSFEESRSLHTRLLSDVDSPAARAIVSFFECWQPDKAEEHSVLAEVLPELEKGANLVFRVDGDFAQNDPAIRAAWQMDYYSPTEVAPSVCLVTGLKVPPARLHPKIKGVLGAQSSGASLVSFNAEAYNSYGKDQGLNAPVSRQAAAAYGKALNYMLADREHRVRFGDTTVVFWAKGGQTAPQDMMACMFDDRGMEHSGLKAAMERLADGKTTQWDGEDVSPETQFYILGLAPNASRLSVRFFLRDSFGVFAGRLLEHQKRLEIARPSFDKREELSFWALLNETANQKSKDKKPPHSLEGELVRAVFTGGRYPVTLLNSVMLRIRADHEITRGRAAIIKAYYLKNKHKECPEEVLTVSQNDSKYTAYCLGQLFSILEAIQQVANPGINATIKDKYFSSASTRPDSVFPTLIDLAQKHLRKLDTGLRIHYEKELGKIVQDLEAAFPARLTPPQQGAFQIGYYHMTQKRYTKKEEKQNV